MLSNIKFLYKPNGNIEQTSSDAVVLYAGGVATTSYTLEISKDIVSEVLPSDIVFISFKRPDGAEAQQLMTHDPIKKHWYMISSGWELNGKNVGLLEVSFVIRRFSKLPPQTLVSTKTTETVTLSISPSSAYTPQEIADSDAEQILAIIGEQSLTLSGHEDRLDGIERSNPIIDITTDISTGKGIKYFFDGSSIEFTFGGGGDVIYANPVIVVNFDTQSWVSVDGDEYELVISGESLGVLDNKFLVAVDALENGAFVQTANSVVKGSDGSVLMHGVTVPYAGRLIIVSGVHGGGGSGSGGVAGVRRNGVLLPLDVIDDTVNIIVPETAQDLIFEGDQSVYDIIGDVGTALDLINGEVV